MTSYFDNRYKQNLDELYETAKERNELRKRAEELEQQLAAVQAERESVSSQLWDCENERDGLKERLAATEIGRSIETFTAAEHITALEAMGASHVSTKGMAYSDGTSLLILPPGMRNDPTV